MTIHQSETKNHMIEVSEGFLTIDTKRFPDDCVSLEPEETEEVLNLLLNWKSLKDKAEANS